MSRPTSSAFEFTDAHNPSPTSNKKYVLKRDLSVFKAWFPFDSPSPPRNADTAVSKFVNIHTHTTNNF